MKPLLSICTIATLTALAACGGGDGGDNPTAEYATDSARASQLIAQTGAQTRTAAEAMPVTGIAEYDGVVGMAFGGQPASIESAEMIGEIDLRANFSTGTMTGELDDFNTSAGRELNGELRLSSGQISGAGFSADIDGRLTGTSAAPGTVSGSIEGDFLGTGADALRGTGTGTSDQGSVGLILRGVRDYD